MFKNFIQKLNPFGKKEDIVLDESEKEGIEVLLRMYPEFWLPLKKVIYSRMNMYSRRLVTAKNEDMINLQSRIAELDDLISCLTEIKSKNLSVKRTKEEKTIPSMEKIEKNKLKEKEELIMKYIRSDDIRDSNGAVRLSA